MKNLGLITVTALLLAGAQASLGDGLRDWVRAGNRLYNEGQYGEAMKEYDRALTEEAGSPEAKFNKANAFYRMEDYGDAMELYGEVAAKSKDMGLVAKSRYNLGNCHFRQGMRQKDSDLKKCMEELEAAVGAWRQVLDIEPGNIKAAKNIETARLIIKDILDQLNKNKQEQEKSDKQNDDSNQQEKSQDEAENSQQQNQDEQSQEKSEQDEKPEGEPERQSQQQEQIAPKVSAEEILDKEQQQRKEREKSDKARYVRVEKDW